MNEKTYKSLEFIWFATIVIGIIMILVAWNYTLNLILLFWGVLIVCLAYLGYIATDIVDHYIRNKKVKDDSGKPTYKLASIDTADALESYVVGYEDIKSLYLKERSADLKRAIIAVEYNDGSLEYRTVEDPILFYKTEGDDEQ